MRGLLADIGTLEWSRETQGILRGSERVRYTTAVLLQTARIAPRLLLARAGLWGGGVDPSRFVPPDTALTRRVLEACAQLHPMLVQHGLRSYYYARGLGEVDGLSCDDEALFVAAVLHDFAFPASPELATERCFSLVGAEAAAELLRDSSLTEALQHAVLDGITLHLNPYVPRERGVLQHLLHAGVLADVVGARAWELDRAGVQRVCDAHPRLDFTRRGLRGFRAQAARAPGCRSQLALRCGFGAALGLAPWTTAAQPVQSGA